MNLPENMTLQATLESGRRDELQKSRLAKAVNVGGQSSILLAVLISPWLFGSVQYWAQFGIAICVMLALVFWWFETAMQSKEKQFLPYLLIPMLLGAGIGLFQLVPLPATLGDLLLGRQTELYENFSGVAADNVGNVRKISLNPSETSYHLQLLAIAMGGVLIGARFFQGRSDIRLLFAAVTINGVAITLMGLFQKFTSNSATLFWTIELTQGGNPFGPFVNRNNAAGYLLMCLAAAIGLFTMFMDQRRTAGPVQMVSREIPVWRQMQMYVLYFIADLTASKLAAIIGIVVISTGVLTSLSRGGVVALLGAGILTILFTGWRDVRSMPGF